MVVSSKSCKFRPNRWFFVIFYEMSHFFHLFAEKLTKTLKHGSFIEKLQALSKSMIFRAFWRNEPLFAEKFTKTPKHGSFLEKLQVLAKSMIFRAFSRNEPLFATFSWRVDQNAETWLFPREVASFGQIDDFSAKSESFREKARKIIDLAKTNNFSSKLPCLGVLVSFSAKTCKKWLISRKRTKNHPFGQNLQLFQETTMFRRFGQLFSKKLQKVAHFEKMQEKSSILPKLATFRENYHVSAFWWTFQQKVAKTASFRPEARKTIDLPKICNSSTKLPCFGVLVIFSGKSCRKGLISWKSTKNHRFAQNLQVFEETTMFRRFDQFFSKKLQKVAHFVKKNETSSIWPKVATFPANYHVSAFWSTFQQKGGKSGSFREKWRKIIDLA